MPLFVSVSMIPVGLVLTGWGLWASGRPSRVVAVVGALAAPAGVALALCGTLLVCVPDFFTG